jgi:hypothetical protein
MPGPGGGDAIDALIPREELFVGPFMDRAPDLFPTFAVPGVAASGSLARRALWEDRRKTSQGTHHPDGIVAAFGDGIAPAVPSTIEAADVGASVLALLGCALPADIDGDPVLAAEPVPRSSTSVTAETLPESPYSPEDERAIVDHLRGLGYFE